MKILVLVTSYPNRDNPNANIFAHYQAKALVKAGYDVDIMYIDVRSIRRKRKWGFKKYVNDGLNVYRYAFPCGPIKFLVNSIAKHCAKKCFKRYMKIKGKPDLIHSHFLDASLCAYELHKKYNVDYICTEHSSHLLNDVIKKKEIKQINKVYSNSKKTISVSETLRKEMKKYTKKEIYVIPNILLDIFHILPVNKSDCFTFLSIGNLIESKRFELTIKAFEIFHRENTNSRLEIYGDGLLKNSLIQLIKDLKCEDCIHINGRVKNNELPEIYNRSNVFVLPSAYETFGVVYIEALACGLPVITSRNGGAEEIIDEENGIILNNVCTAKELYNVMLEIFNNNDKYDRVLISKNAIQKYGEDRFIFSLKNIIND